jgi:hypothetical protein
LFVLIDRQAANMKKVFITIWFTVLCFLLLANVHAWEVPPYLRINAGARMWFTQIQGDLIQKNRVKIDLVDNLGLKRDRLAWEFFSTWRIGNIHLIRLNIEPMSTYESRNESFQRITSIRAGYDLDFYMSPQSLFGVNLDINMTSFETGVNALTLGQTTYDYHVDQTRTIPLVGLHGTFYPIMEDISIRPNFSARVKWWNYESLETWDWEALGSVDIPVNRCWTWAITGGYRFWHTKSKREVDTIDVNRSGFFLESSLLF